MKMIHSYRQTYLHTLYINKQINSQQKQTKSEIVKKEIDKEESIPGKQALNLLDAWHTSTTSGKYISGEQFYIIFKVLKQ